MLSQTLFVIVLAVASYFIYRRVKQISDNIKLGLSEDRGDQKPQRIRNMLLIAFGQKKMFKRPIPAILHLMVYLGFLIINIEVLEFIIDGIIGTHRVFAPIAPGLYNAALNAFEFLAIAVLVSCVFFLIRRNILGVKRFLSSEMKGWPTLDANIILIAEIFLMSAILVMNATDQLLQSQNDHYTMTGTLFFSSQLVPLFQNLSETTLILIERTAWWIHIIGILAFAVYVTYSKHLHIFLAFPNTYFANLYSDGKMNNMTSVTNEVKIMLGLPDADNSTPAEGIKFGAKDVTDLSRKDLMSAYTCTECGRCTDNCPANMTGKALSPRKIMMDTRDRMEDVGKQLDKTGSFANDGKSLLGDYITKEEINACTSCNACVEACPVMINPLSIILELRRHVAMEEAASPAPWNAMFGNIETNFAPWKFSPSDRFQWSENLQKD